jgi:phage shock protein PspC (stress-responsive transcriptional regulator)
MDDRLYKSSSDRVLTGVAGGLAERMRVDPSLVRLVWVLLAIFSGGIFALVYLIMAVVVPERPTAAMSSPPVSGAEGAQTSPAPGPGQWIGPDGQPVSAAVDSWTSGPAEQATSGRGPGAGALIGGLVLVGIGVWVLLARYVPEFAFGEVWPWAALGLGIVLVVLGFVGPSRR